MSPLASYRRLFSLAGPLYVAIAFIGRLPLAMAQMGTLLLVAGTRPECIKLVPVIDAMLPRARASLASRSSRAASASACASASHPASSLAFAASWIASSCARIARRAICSRASL